MLGADSHCNVYKHVHFSNTHKYNLQIPSLTIEIQLETLMLSYRFVTI